MNFRAIFIAAIASLVAGQTQSKVILYDAVQPFAQVKPTTNDEKAVLKYKPQLKIEKGCHPYPAVQQDGAIGSGLKWTGPQDDGCKGSPLGSQVYARSTWVKDKWAIMYTWYFPRGRPPLTSPSALGSLGHRHGWEYAVIWLNEPSPNATLLAVSCSAAVGWAKEFPPPQKYLDGNSLKVAYYYDDVWGDTAVKYTEEKGEFQDLITWNQLTPAARDALSNTDWDETPFNVARVKMPMKDGVFMEKLNGAYPF
ncbi:Necrosis inducing protein NPP1 [Phytophthora megakarya]|uniref:Necrosis inducing protein NPP1 n=1 Tax=Phytophthora megakarya TaxID=4795 RepID=A0A225VVD0_9STRA|nr:Necrosis inducing protein NPP1 [Phytophthora megakarya]